MFITFHKQVSVNKTYRSPQPPLPLPQRPSVTPPPPTPSAFSFFVSLFPKFLFLSTVSCDMFCIFKAAHSCSLVFLSSRLWVSSSSMLPLFLAVAIREKASTKRDFFCNEKFRKSYSTRTRATHDAPPPLPWLCCNQHWDANEEVELTSEVDM